MSDKLQVGFWAGINWSNPEFTAAARPFTGNIQTMTIGGPRSRERVIQEIEACEIALAGLRKELEGLPEGKSGE